ncbi:uncharacterized protein Fot_40334 [Forsythia ovata]|uniref:Uncharacterized protein n=1 Tax=Forsythia ovata TaxID=205694 RepID=A0ABD1S777_9LAMI
MEIRNYRSTEAFSDYPVQFCELLTFVLRFTGHQQANHLNRDARQTLRSVLLICYVDGTVRLWIETRDGRIRRAEKGSRDQKAPRLFFGVIAVLEVNQTLNKSLGSNVFVCSATKVEGIIATGKEAAIIHM